MGTPTYTKPTDPVGGFTAREQAAILLRRPNSGTEWLDAMISDAAITEVGTQLLAGMLSHYGVNAGESPAQAIHQDQMRAMTDAAFEAARTAVYWEGVAQ